MLPEERFCQIQIGLSRFVWHAPTIKFDNKRTKLNFGIPQMSGRERQRRDR